MPDDPAREIAALPAPHLRVIAGPVRAGGRAMSALHVRDDVAVGIEHADPRYAAGRERLLPARFAQQVLGLEYRRRCMVGALGQRRRALGRRRLLRETPRRRPDDTV